jgi:hypothetical protein
MGLVRCFDQDVFVSYGWLDNKEFGLAEERWVSEFSSRLQVRLSEIAGDHAVVWRDPSIQGNAQVWPTIRKAISRSALFLSVVSPRYVRSVSCRMEVAHFQLVKLLRREPEEISAARVFQVIKLPVDTSDLPRLYRAQTGYEFYSRDSERGYPRELVPTELPYWEQINRLAFDMGAALQSMKRLGSNV